jgi:predicted naringenin-chalcone synthase
LTSSDFKNAPEILSVGRALPPHYADRETLIAALREEWVEQHYNLDRLEELHRAVRVTGRYLALPIDEYAALGSFGKRNEAWQRVAAELGESAIRSALRAARLSPRDVDALFFVTVTGISTPSLDATLMYSRMTASSLPTVFSSSPDVGNRKTTRPTRSPVANPTSGPIDAGRVGRASGDQRLVPFSGH